MAARYSRICRGFHVSRRAPRPPRVSYELAIELTAVFERTAEGGFVAYVEELPGANTQGETLEEARANLREAVQLVLEANRALAEEALAGRDVIRESLRLTA